MGNCCSVPNEENDSNVVKQGREAKVQNAEDSKPSVSVQGHSVSTEINYSQVPSTHFSDSVHANKTNVEQKTSNEKGSTVVKASSASKSNIALLQAKRPGTTSRPTLLKMERSKVKILIDDKRILRSIKEKETMRQELSKIGRRSALSLSSDRFSPNRFSSATKSATAFQTPGSNLERNNSNRKIIHSNSTSSISGGSGNQQRAKFLEKDLAKSSSNFQSAVSNSASEVPKSTNKSGRECPDSCGSDLNVSNSDVSLKSRRTISSDLESGSVIARKSKELVA
ncbi:hypothetical protein BLOT_010533 [Blomia tropicalis]|nr:hypothetical protein BLOT_010533 [Blomia tropicalis]